MNKKMFSCFLAAGIGLICLTKTVQARDSGPYMGAITSQVDTNASTTTTDYTPRHIGDILLGQTGASNCIWIARGLTTADWSLVSDDSDGTIADADISDMAAIAHAKLAPVLPGQVLVGNASSQAVAVAVSGDATMAADGEISLVETQALTKVTEIAHRVVTSYSASARVCVDFQAGLTNGQVYTYAVGTLGAVPGVSATYSTTSTAQSPTSSVEVISKTISNCVIVCQEGCTVDLTLIGVR